MRNIEVDIRAFLIPGSYIWIRFIEVGWVPVIVRDNHPHILYTNTVFDNEHPINLQQWYNGLKQGNIMICPN